MGIYDREYVRMGPNSRSGLGSLRFVSVNIWLIIINVAVFLLGSLAVIPASPVVVRQLINKPVPIDQVVEQQTFYTLAGTPVETRGAPKGAAANRILVDKRTIQVMGATVRAEPVGVRTYRWMDPLDKWGHLSTYTLVRELQVWRVLTFQFLHANFLHLFFNMFGLWIFGGMVEQYLGARRYLAFYLTCGIFGGLTYLLLNALGQTGLQLPTLLVDDPRTPLVGASAGVFGVIVAAAFIAPNAIVQLIFPPVPIKLKLMAYAYVAIAAWNLIRGGQNAGGDAAHIGGAIAGYFFIRNAHLLRDFFDVFTDSRKGTRPAGRRDADAAEVDRILTKVRDGGLKSLSEAEKRALRRASERPRVQE